MLFISQLIVPVSILAIASIAAVTDARKGVIPNWLTLPALFGAPSVYGLIQGIDAFVSSLLGLFICGFAPFLLFIRRATGGGDVKLFAAIGSICGVRWGMEIELISLIVAAIYALARLALNGKLMRTLTNSGWLLLDLVLPRARRKEIRPEYMASVRMGGAVLVAALWVILKNYPNQWMLP
ncbi:MAG: prepilin peptidase [Deltaproteobacteria bacterium]|nr:prepilin peptidase [Deltaproteobacteria bacterium]